ncbi:MAG: hypothetical protein AAGA32_15990 [Pseudomonadota bacterium]
MTLPSRALPAEGLPVVVGVAAGMAAIAVLCLLVGLALRDMGTRWRLSLGAVMLVELPGEGNTAAAHDLLAAAPDVRGARTIEAARLSALLGIEDSGIEGLALPALIEVDAPADARAAVEAMLAAEIPGIRVTAPSPALQLGAHRLAMAGWIGLALAALSLATVGAVVYAATGRMLLAARETLSTLRLIGAEARDLRQRIVQPWVVGASLGAAVGGGISALLADLITQATTMIWLDKEVSLGVALAATVATGLVAWAAARLAWASADA